MPRQDAVLVGINDYGGNGRAPDLNSCIADVYAMEEILRTQYGFLRITRLLDAQATVENVDAALDELFRNVTPEDRLVFYFSGHGYRPVRDGRLIEVLVLHGSRFYEDRQLSAKTQGLPPGVLTVILDSCFSGGMFKLLIPSPEGFDVGRVKVWTPPVEQVHAEEAALGQMTQVEYKAFGLAPTTLPLAVAKEFGFPEPPAEMKALLLEASRAPSAAGTLWAGAPIGAAERSMLAGAGALQPGAVRGAAAARPEVAMAAMTAPAGAHLGMAGSMGQPAAPKGPAAARPEIAMAALAGAQPGMAGSMGQPEAAWATAAGAPMGGTKCLLPGIQPVTALDTLAVEETAGAAGAGGMGTGGMGAGGMGAGGMGAGGMGPGGMGTGGMGFGAGPGATKDPALGGARGGGAEPAGEGLKAPTLLVAPGELEVRGVLLAASQANEPASAKTNQTEELSAFTFGLRRVLRELGWELSPGEMIPNVATRLHSMGFSQTPLLHTPVDLPPDLPHRSFVLLRPRRSVGEALGTAVLSGLQPGAGASTMTPGMGGGVGKGITPGPQPYAALTSQQATALLDLIARDPQLAGTVIATLSGSAATGAAPSAGAIGAPSKAAGAVGAPSKAAGWAGGAEATGPAGAAPGAAGALTGTQARALLDLIAGDPQLARTVMTTLSEPMTATGPRKGLEVAPPPAEAGPAMGPDPQSLGAKQWLAAALEAAGAPR